MDKDRFITLALVLVKDYAVLCEEGVSGVDGGSIHLSTQSFLAMFDDYETTKRECETYPFKLSVTIDGVNFFTVTEFDATFIPETLKPDYILKNITATNEAYRKAGE